MHIKLGEETKAWALVDRDGHVALSEICPSYASAKSLREADQLHQAHRGPLDLIPVAIRVADRVLGEVDGSQR
ncbi:hypothetical protein SAMN04487785_102405 [Dyella jiangningensis]|uniref:hypothetical protein n=1 Tax=Dyella sp. AtDHG13 TaxID=1938897 RepID=UPI0008922C0C|nr:hypothetical protein [Dyella sp. AtDHG13]PXV60677.1 hypothetical protein BDW41_102404 [Dyella sp. AtDHG13]SDJ54762.1 hypothetical protein SAMN04487785_102405 [Dyella jiangningensis]